MASSSISLYEVLGIPASATRHEIKAAYRRLARQYHPDVVSMTKKDTPANEFMKIHTAYSTLSDPSKRASYDCTLFWPATARGAPSSISTAAFAGGYRHRTWETDQCW
ncbi:chaperone protein dnaJ 11, chloroplastic-like [Malania oleifera]|uniref:chaperone protein dnaJ 11, chloroplastic-like n=1 Tax=Malania oleifera TaxID=397392 RepID=UPI0025AEB9F9|nr:chaperone protein dnaJ 11, chloroplastic-like [Malania oleifera]